MAGELQDYSIDQAAGAIALTLDALGSLLLNEAQRHCLLIAATTCGSSNACKVDHFSTLSCLSDLTRLNHPVATN